MINRDTLESDTICQPQCLVNDEHTSVYPSGIVKDFAFCCVTPWNTGTGSQLYLDSNLMEDSAPLNRDIHNRQPTWLVTRFGLLDACSNMVYWSTNLLPHRTGLHTPDILQHDIHGFLLKMQCAD